MWTGVALARVFEHLGGVDDAMAFLTATGGEELPDEVDREAVVVERSVPLDKALRDHKRIVVRQAGDAGAEHDVLGAVGSDTEENLRRGNRLPAG